MGLLLYESVLSLLLSSSLSLLLLFRTLSLLLLSLLLPCCHQDALTVRVDAFRWDVLTNSSAYVYVTKENRTIINVDKIFDGDTFFATRSERAMFVFFFLFLIFPLSCITTLICLFRCCVWCYQRHIPAERRFQQPRLEDIEKMEQYLVHCLRQEQEFLAVQLRHRQTIKEEKKKAAKINRLRQMLIDGQDFDDNILNAEMEKEVEEEVDAVVAFEQAFEAEEEEEAKNAEEYLEEEDEIDDQYDDRNESKSLQRAFLDTPQYADNISAVENNYFEYLRAYNRSFDLLDEDRRAIGDLDARRRFYRH